MGGLATSRDNGRFALLRRHGSRRTHVGARASILRYRRRSLSGQARRALTPMLTPLGQGGTGWHSSEGLILEEVPLKVPKTILNGWIFALYGLDDLAMVDDYQDARAALEATLGALLARLRTCDTYAAGFWSFYDTSGTLASPFYHRLHIAQLQALELSHPEHAERFGKLRKTLQEQLASRQNVARAVTVKSYKKLRRPPEGLKP